MKDCSFSPKINKYSKILIKNNPNYSKPIFLRNDDKKDYYKQKYEVKFTHMPKINKKYNNKLDIYSRLYNKSEIKNDNYENAIDYPFRPITNYYYEKNHKQFVYQENILKREKLLNDYINHQKIEINYNENKINKLTFTPNTSCTSKSLYSIKKEKQKIFKPYFNKLNRMTIKKSRPNRSVNNINRNELNINESGVENINNKSIIKNKSMNKNKSFLMDYIDKRHIKNNNNHLKLISFKQKFNYNNNFNINHNLTKGKNKNNSNENAIKNYIDKINLKSKKESNKGICINLSENCKNIKIILNKNRNKNQ